jgi:hypothetical protein
MLGQFFQAGLVSEYGGANLAGSGKAFEQRSIHFAAKNGH